MDQPPQSDADRHTTGRQHLRWVLHEYLSRSYPALLDGTRPPQLALRSEHATLPDGRTVTYDWEMINAREADIGNDEEDNRENFEIISRPPQDIVLDRVMSPGRSFDFEQLSRCSTPIQEYFEHTMPPFDRARSPSCSHIEMMTGIGAGQAIDERFAWNKDARAPSRTCSNLEILFMFKDDFAPVTDRISASCPSLRDSQMQTAAPRNWTTVLIRLRAYFQFRSTPWLPISSPSFNLQSFQTAAQKAEEVWS